MATTDKYDRQLRLWGAAGQRALLTSHILLISADGAGSETLKNLVLPGIGAFTILDDHRVSASDLGSNFFVTEDSIAKSRAEVVAENLCEMNPDVKGYATVGNYRNLLRSEPTFFDPFTLIIASNIPPVLLMTLAERCWDRDVPLLLVRSYGLIGSVRVQIKEHFISNHHQANSLYDLRLSSPLPALQQAYEEIKREYGGLNSSERKHVPYLYLLMWALEEWREVNNSSSTTVPSTMAEKESFRSLLSSLITNTWQLGETIETDESGHQFTSPAGQNGVEAMQQAHILFTKKTLTQEILDFLPTLTETDTAHEDDEQRPLRIQQQRRLFRTLITFLKRSGGVLPQSGSIPDMTATSARFLQLQQLYSQEANKDCELFLQLLRQREADEPVEDTAVVPLEEAVSFCKNVLSTSLLSTTQVTEEENGLLFTVIGEHLKNDANEDDPSLTPLSWAMAIKACDLFFMQQGRFPGDDLNKGDDWQLVDAEKVWVILKDLASKCTAPIIDDDPEAAVPQAQGMDEDGNGDSYKPPATISKATAMEITRYGGAELHTISAMIGGVAAQEAVKLITGQYIPLDALFVYNGIASIGGTYSLKR